MMGDPPRRGGLAGRETTLLGQDNRADRQFSTEDSTGNGDPADEAAKIDHGQNPDDDGPLGKSCFGGACEDASAGRDTMTPITNQARPSREPLL